ncbi:MAG: signal peptidase II [Alphaproteobacteria bacterium]|nr:signal peptidase II [Alphaproteobacteria bacterium]MDE2495771.1 signal peptidase II [Alphaproteobacteria bacterium]
MSTRDYGIVAAAVTLLLDQGSKLLMLYKFGFATMGPGAAVSVLPFFNLVMVWNPGISYGLFPASGPEGTVFLATFQLLAAGALAWWLWFVRSRALAISLGLVIGGALGNLIDRLVYGKVADFFHFYGLGYDWYVFNVADAAITFGVIGLLYDALLKPETPENGVHKE